MKNKPKKASVKKNKGEIEVSLGDGQVTKYDIMTAIAKKYTIYEATVWLNNPIEGKTKKTPAFSSQEDRLQSNREQQDDFQILKLNLKTRKSHNFYTLCNVSRKLEE